MKTTTKISEISQEDLVNLLTTATYGSEYIDIDWVYQEECIKSKEEGDSREDIYARMLLNGYKIEVRDYYAEDETDFYGNLHHEWNEEDECMVYHVGIEDISHGIAKCLDLGGWTAECANDLIYKTENLDLYEAEAIMQVIVFGEVIYG